jgi:hypothetical protein
MSDQPLTVEEIYALLPEEVLLTRKDEIINRIVPILMSKLNSREQSPNIHRCLVYMFSRINHAHREEGYISINDLLETTTNISVEDQFELLSKFMYNLYRFYGHNDKSLFIVVCLYFNSNRISTRKYK